MGYVFVSDSKGMIGLTIEGVASLAEYKTWLANNKPTFQYELATPTYETLDPESQAALNSLETFNGVTYVEVDSRVQPAGIRAEYATTKSAGYSLKALNNSESYLASVTQ
jgi:hypothetical protein